MSEALLAALSPAGAAEAAPPLPDADQAEQDAQLSRLTIWGGRANLCNQLDYFILTVLKAGKLQCTRLFWC